MASRSARAVVTLAFVASVTLLILAVKPSADHAPEAPAEAPVEPEAEPVLPPEVEQSALAVAEPMDLSPRWLEHTIQRGETLTGILRRNGADADQALAALHDVFDASSLRSGAVLQMLLAPGEPGPRELRYSVDDERTLVLQREGNAWNARVDVASFERKPSFRDLVVRSSLWQSAVEAGLRPADVVNLARVFEYDVDFNTEVQAGARAQIVVDELWAEGRLARLARPLAVRFTNGAREYLAFHYTSADGTDGYYDAAGQRRKKAFLRSPLEFSRVTSGFNLKRFHPVLKKPRPHYGVDFGAPIGTPVRAVGDGVVEMADRNGGHGNYVKLDHEGPYSSSYSHLSSISVRRGAKVRQGEIVGFVGKTGLATGPHLHFQFWVDGRYVNPLDVELPQSEALQGEELVRFQAQRDALLAQLEQGAQEQNAAVADAVEEQKDTAAQ